MGKGDERGLWLSCILKWRCADLRFFLFFTALLIYGLWGAPTPDDPGVAETVIGALLVVGVGVQGMLSVFHVRNEPFWKKAGVVVLLYGLSIPLLLSLVHGNAQSLVFRDLIPFLFFLLPLFFAPLIANKDRYVFWAVVAMVLIGVSFALRILLPAAGGYGLGLLHWQMLSPSDPGYLVNAPTVLFGSILLLGLSVTSLYSRLSLSSFVGATLCAALGLVLVLAMTLIVQRASLALLVLSIGFLMTYLFVKNPRKGLAPLLAICVVTIFFWPDIVTVIHVLAAKTASVGANMRIQDAQAVLDVVRQSPLTFLFGMGWGATYESPAVADITVGYTHNLFTTFLLKGGFVGVVLVVFYVLALANRLFAILFYNPVLAVALAAPFLRDVFLYASFKSLDFGLIVMMIALWPTREDKLHWGESYSIQKILHSKTEPSGQTGI